LRQTSRRNSRSGASGSKLAAAQPDAPPSRYAVAVALIVFALVFAAGEIYSYTRLSATFDEPGHLAAGYAALAQSDYRLDIEHPPFERMWAALPLLALPVHTTALAAVDQQTPETVAYGGPFDIGHRFLYRDNDADRLLYRARFMIVLLGIGLGVVCFFWTLEWLGWRAALVALVLYATEPNIAAHAELVTTDFGVTCFLFASVYFLWRASRRWTIVDAAAAVVCAVLAVLSKFSGLAVLPLFAVLVTAAAIRRRVSVRHAATVLLSLCVFVVFAAWAAYGFRYDPSRNPDWRFALHAGSAAQAAVPVTASLASWIDAHRLLPNALTEGFVHNQGLGTGRPAFLLGDYSTFGWWSYFPIAVALKTPTVLLVLLGTAVLTRAGRNAMFGLDGAFLILPVVLFLTFAMAAAVNIGLRHVLPIYPFLIVLAAAGARALFASRPQRYRVVLTIIALAAVLETAWAYPDPLTFFNVFAGGPKNGFQSLADSNLDWGQALKPLGVWVKDHNVDRINLAYFGTADPKYYGMNVRYIWGTIAPDVSPAQQAAPEVPGYVAISATLLDGVPFDDRLRDFYRPLRDRVPTADIDGSIKVFWIDRPWW
jgi:4-amino-4-deoxy-L-arabinose transferase-like glycosyltransferase